MRYPATCQTWLHVKRQSCAVGLYPRSIPTYMVESMVDQAAQPARTRGTRQTRTRQIQADQEEHRLDESELDVKQRTVIGT